MMDDIFTSHMPPEVVVWSWSGEQFTVHDAVQYSSSRSLSNPVATARIMLKGDRFRSVTNSRLVGEKYDDVFELYDLVQIKIRDRSGREWVDLIGVVHDIQQNANDNNDYPSQDFALEIRSIGEYLIRYQVFWMSNLPIAALSRIGYLLRTKGKPVKGRPDQMLREFFNLYINDKLLVEAADGRTLDKLFELDLYQPKDGLTNINLSGIGSEKSLWDTMLAYADLPWNMLYTDVPAESLTPLVDGGGGATAYYGAMERIYLRKTPFTPETWSQLANSFYYEYDGSDRIDGGDNVSRNADNIVNFAWVAGRPLYGNFDQLTALHQQSGGKLPKLNEEMIKRFCLRRMEARTEFVQFLNKDAINQPMSGADARGHNTAYTHHWQMLERRAQELFDFFSYPNFRQGSFEVIGRIGMDHKEGARIGAILKDTRNGLEYLINQINQDWSLDQPPWTTTIGVERGHRPADLADWSRKVEKANKAVALRPTKTASKPVAKPIPQSGRPQEIGFDPVTQAKRDALKAALAGALQHPAPANVSGNVYIGVDYGYTEWPSRNGKYRFHKGVDMNAPLGADLLAVEAGVVEFSGVLSSSYGETVILKHTHQAGIYYSVYAHCNSRDVEANQSVASGDVIAKMGRTGNAIGVHLHFEIRLLHNLPGHVVDSIPLLSGLTNSNGGPFFGQAILRERPAPY